MAKCKGSKEDGSICGRNAMYKSEYCKGHQDQDSSVNLCMGKTAGKPCSRLALEGLLFCRQHRVQIADLEKLQCPRGCGLLTYKLLGNKVLCLQRMQRFSSKCKNDGNKAFGARWNPQRTS